jgi:hypothetical protein
LKRLSDYTVAATERCERVLVTVLGNVGPWRECIYLAGGLAPRYIVGELPEGASPHIGTTDIDLVISLSVDGDEIATYETLERNLKNADFEQDSRMSFRWKRKVDGVSVLVEFLCETDRVEEGRIFRPGHRLGTKLSAFNVSGAHLAARDYIEVDVENERLDDGGLSKVSVRVANLLPYVVLKINAFQDRHENKDAYDLIFCLRNFRDEPETTGRELAASPVANDPQVVEALALLEERFVAIENDGPAAYAAFLVGEESELGAEDERNVLRREAIAVVRRVLAGFRGL